MAAITQKLIFTGEIELKNIPEDAYAALKQALTPLGKVYLFNSSLVGYQEPPEEFDCVVIRITCDDSEPYYLEGDMGAHSNTETTIEDDELNRLMETGICVDMFATVPRFDRYGSPGFTSRPEMAHLYVSEHGFKCSSWLEASARDTGDDSAEMVWLKIAIPKAKAVA